VLLSRGADCLVQVPVEKVESVASIHLIPELDRHFLSQNKGNWDLSENRGNLSGTCR
jgi:hypothetical protein